MLVGGKVLRSLRFRLLTVEVCFALQDWVELTSSTHNFIGPLRCLLASIICIYIRCELFFIKDPSDLLVVPIVCQLACVVLLGSFTESVLLVVVGRVALSDGYVDLTDADRNLSLRLSSLSVIKLALLCVFALLR